MAVRSFEDDQQRAGFDRRALDNGDFPYPPGTPGPELVFHLHRFHDHESLARVHLVACGVSLLGLVWLVALADGPRALLAAWIYGLATVLLYLVSSSYHVFARGPRVRPVMRRLDHAVGVRDRDVALLQQVPMLRVLPLPSVEQLARGLEPVSVPAGDAVFEQGDVGEVYYVIESGEADVLGDGVLVAGLGPGEGFGEIALLRRPRRTATVRARTDLRLHALAGERFLPVVLGFTPAEREAAAGVDQLLDRWSPGRDPQP